MGLQAQLKLSHMLYITIFYGLDIHSLFYKQIFDTLGTAGWSSSSSSGSIGLTQQERRVEHLSKSVKSYLHKQVDNTEPSPANRGKGVETRRQTPDFCF